MRELKGWGAGRVFLCLRYDTLDHGLYVVPQPALCTRWSRKRGGGSPRRTNHCNASQQKRPQLESCLVGECEDEAIAGKRWCKKRNTAHHTLYPQTPISLN